jgi:lysozyme family protein
MTLLEALDRVVAVEAGFVDDPVDHGGPTKFGITIRWLSDVLGRTVTRDEIAALTRDQAIIYYRRWTEASLAWVFVPCVAGAGPVVDPLAMAVLDASVHHGIDRAVRLLQLALAVKVDGVVGPKTRAALEALAPDRRLRLAVRMSTERMRFMARLVERNPAQLRFLEGWLDRAADLIDEFVGGVNE